MLKQVVPECDKGAVVNSLALSAPLVKQVVWRSPARATSEVRGEGRKIARTKNDSIHPKTTAQRSPAGVGSRRTSDEVLDGEKRILTRHRVILGGQS